MDRLYETQLDYVSFWEVSVDLFLAINPINILLVVFAIIFMVMKKNRTFLPLVLTVIFSFALLTLFRGKFYYYFPIILTILPLGAVALEQLWFSKRKWIFYPIIGLQLLMGVLLVPFGLPIDNLESYLENVYPYEENDVVEGTEYNIPFEERYSDLVWGKTIDKLAEVYQDLSENEKDNTLIWGKHYRQAGAVNLFGENHNLPKAFSLHGSFYSWLPNGDMPNTIIALSYTDSRFFQQYFENVVLVENVLNPYADEKEKRFQNIFICRTPKQNFTQLKLLFKERIFE